MLVASARAGGIAATLLYATNPVADLFAAEAKSARALSLMSDHLRAHMSLGSVFLWTKRAVNGIADSMLHCGNVRLSRKFPCWLI
jgi:hypothetical protein